MRPVSTFFNIQLSNSRHCYQQFSSVSGNCHSKEKDRPSDIWDCGEEQRIFTGKLFGAGVFWSFEGLGSGKSVKKQKEVDKAEKKVII